jgi:hypothetical protein
LEDKGLLKDYYERRFIFSAMAMWLDKLNVVIVIIIVT